MIFSYRLLDLPFLVILMAISAGAMFLPAAYAVTLGEFAVARAFFYSGSILLILTAMIALATATQRPRNTAQSQLFMVIGAYLVVPILLAVPLQQSLPGVGFGAAWFEMLSCFTTTGASLFDDPASLAAPLHLWRAMAGWMGGFFILLATVTVLAPIGLGGLELLGGRATGRAGGLGQITRIADPSHRIVHFTGLLFPTYAGLTLILWVGLLLAGDTALIALCHAMSTLSTSGISPLHGLQGTASGTAGEALIFVFLGLAVTRAFWPGTTMADRVQRLWRDPELRLALLLLASVTLFMVVRYLATSHSDAGPGVLHNIWAAAFTSLSFLTTTGFQSAHWPDVGAPGLILLGLAMIGGGVATTAGGVKLLRVYALLRHGERELERIVHPHSIGGHGPIARQLRREGAYLAWIFFMVFGLTIAVITAALTLAGFDFQTAMVLCIACLTTTGQLALVVGEAGTSYASLTAGPLGILGVAMVLGRLEIIALFALFAANWRVR